MTSVLDLFSVGIGPSSSHTVGPMRAANRFITKLRALGIFEKTNRVKVCLYGSLGATGRGHGSDGAVILGLMGMRAKTVDIDRVALMLEAVRTRSELLLAGETVIPFKDGKDLKLLPGKRLPFHPNGLSFTAFNGKEKLLEDVFYSIGGGFVVAEEEIDTDISDVQADVEAGPVIDECPYPFTSGQALLDLAAQTGLSICEIMRANEYATHGKDMIDEHLCDVWEVMKGSVDRGCKIEGMMPGLNIKRRAPGLYRKLSASYGPINLDGYGASNHSGFDSDPLAIMDWVNLFALAVNEENATGGRVVTAPTNGAAGIIPAVLHYYMAFVRGANADGVNRFLLTAGAIGKLFKENASISGAEVGCQGEVGSACSMAAAGLTEVLGGTPQQVENAAEIGMEHNLGLTCDPVGGLVQVPCIERNAMAAVKAINAARLALKGDGTHFVSLDKVIRTMRLTGRDMKTQYKETAKGGLAVTVPISATVVDC